MSSSSLLIPAKDDDDATTNATTSATTTAASSYGSCAPHPSASPAPPRTAPSPPKASPPKSAPPAPPDVRRAWSPTQLAPVLAPSLSQASLTGSLMDGGGATASAAATSAATSAADDAAFSDEDRGENRAPASEREEEEETSGGASIDSAAAAADEDDSTFDRRDDDGGGSGRHPPLLFPTMAARAAARVVPPLDRLLLRRTFASDRLSSLHPLLDLLLRNAKHAAPAFVASYLLVVLLLWIPLWLLSLAVTEAGVYLLLVAGIVYGGRCLLRLLAFPGTNVRVYGEVESEFSKYSCKMLEGAAGALEDLAHCVRSGEEDDVGGGEGKVEDGTNPPSPSSSPAARARKRLGADECEGWDLVDAPGCYRRLAVYRDRVLGTYWEVLKCLLEEGGRGRDPAAPAADDGASERGGFYDLGRDGASACKEACKEACKRNLCCEGYGRGRSESSNCDAEGIQLHRSDARGVPGRRADGADGVRTPAGSPTNDGAPSIAARGRATKYGNNPLVGDVGTMGNLTPRARADGKELLDLLAAILDDLSSLESSASNVLSVSYEDREALHRTSVSKEAAECAAGLVAKARELRELATRIQKRHGDAEDAEDEGEEGEDVGAEAVRRRLEEQGGTASSSSSPLGMVRSALRAIGAMIDPPPHDSAFGLDVVRGTFLARYRGARQFWVPRGASAGGGRRDGRRRGAGGGGCGGGRLDVLRVPATPSSADEEPAESVLPLSPRKGRDGCGEAVVAGASEGGKRRRRRAVLYCNPNAGLAEVAAGMGLTGGNVGGDGSGDDEDREPTCWTEYYIEHGYDVYLFNYAGYGRSYGGSIWNDTSSTEFAHGFWAALRRVLFSTFLAFKPSSESIKSDAVAVARHLVDVVGVDELIIHGESIGGMAGAGAARALTTAAGATKSKWGTVLLVCDRTFCNLEAVAERLVGRWSGNAVRLLTPGWSTDVAGDFLAARCPKIVAQDCADEIVHDGASLRAGLSLSAELTKGRTHGVGRIVDAPPEHRLADLDDVSVSESRLTANGGAGACFLNNPPSWPADKHLSWSEVRHFAACARRVGKQATAAKRWLRSEFGGSRPPVSEEEGIEVPYSPDGLPTQSHPESNSEGSPAQRRSDARAIIEVWHTLGRCDGLCGRPLGHAVKEGHDGTIAWLASAVTYGGQALIQRAERRWDLRITDVSLEDMGSSDRVFLPDDFDLRPEGYEQDDEEMVGYPLPIPDVLSSLKEMSAQIAQKTALKEVAAELNYITVMLEYVVSRLTSKENTTLSLQRRGGLEEEQGAISAGCFLNLHCGHNNQYSLEEREKLMDLIRRSCGEPV